MERATCETCKHWDRGGVNYGYGRRPVVRACRGMKSAENLGCDTDCWFGTPPEFFCADHEPEDS